MNHIAIVSLSLRPSFSSRFCLSVFLHVKLHRLSSQLSSSSDTTVWLQVLKQIFGCPDRLASLPGECLRFLSHSGFLRSLRDGPLRAPLPQPPPPLYPPPLPRSLPLFLLPIPRPSARSRLVRLFPDLASQVPSLPAAPESPEFNPAPWRSTEGRSRLRTRLSNWTGMRYVVSPDGVGGKRGQMLCLYILLGPAFSPWLPVAGKNGSNAAVTSEDLLIGTAVKHVLTYSDLQMTRIIWKEIREKVSPSWS